MVNVVVRFILTYSYRIEHLIDNGNRKLCTFILKTRRAILSDIRSFSLSPWLPGSPNFPISLPLATRDRSNQPIICLSFHAVAPAEATAYNNVRRHNQKNTKQNCLPRKTASNAQIQCTAEWFWFRCLWSPPMSITFPATTTTAAEQQSNSTSAIKSKCGGGGRADLSIIYSAPGAGRGGFHQSRADRPHFVHCAILIVWDGCEESFLYVLYPCGWWKRFWVFFVDYCAPHAFGPTAQSEYNHWTRTSNCVSCARSSRLSILSTELRRFGMLLLVLSTHGATNGLIPNQAHLPPAWVVSNEKRRVAASGSQSIFIAAAICLFSILFYIQVSVPICLLTRTEIRPRTAAQPGQYCRLAWG